jgi:hypothetical protein
MRWNRRTVLIGILTTLPVFGFRSCQQEAHDLAAELEVLGTAVSQLLRALGAEEFAMRFEANIHTSVTLLRAWKPGMSATDLLRSLNRLVDDLTGMNNSDRFDRFKALIQLALGTIRAIMDGIAAQGGTGETPHTNVKLTHPPQDAAEFKQYWNAIRAGSPNMDQAPVL